MSELIQESKYITVQEFMPIWTELKEKVGDGRMPSGIEEEKGMDFFDCKKCLVGEAYGGNDDFARKSKGNYCATCFNCAMGSGEQRMRLNAMSRHDTVREFYKFKQYLYDHFMETHPEKLLRGI